MLYFLIQVEQMLLQCTQSLFLMPFFVIVLTCSVNGIVFSLYVCVSVKTSLSKILLMTTSLELWVIFLYMYTCICTIYSLIQVIVHVCFLSTVVFNEISNRNPNSRKKQNLSKYIKVPRLWNKNINKYSCIEVIGIIVNYCQSILFCPSFKVSYTHNYF